MVKKTTQSYPISQCGLEVVPNYPKSSYIAKNPNYCHMKWRNDLVRSQEVDLSHRMSL